MQTVKIGSKGIDVQSLQIALMHYFLGAIAIPIDGVFNDKVKQFVVQFQTDKGLQADGIVGPLTWGMLTDCTKEKFFVAVHGGHGGIDPKTGKYATLPSTGKRYQHFGTEMHTKDGWFLEGVENRIAANEVARQLREKGIFVLVTHHEYKCDYGQLSQHRNAVLPYLREGYKGYTHAFHSNTIDTDNSVEKLNATKGGIVFTAKGYTVSDQIAKKLLSLWKERFGAWVRLEDKADQPSISSDYEANFQVMNDIETFVKAKQDCKYGAILEEFGFFTSLPDARFIMNAENRAKRVDAAVQLAIWVRAHMNTI